MNTSTAPSSLYHTALTLSAIYQQDKKGIEPSVMARFAHQLIAAEIQPGGPYRGNGAGPDFATNLAIAYLFLLFKKPLHQVMAFVDNALQASPRLLTPQLSALYKKYLHLASLQPHPEPLVSKQAYIRASDHIKTLEEPLQTLGGTFLKRIHDADRHYEITQIASYFHQALKTPPKAPRLSSLAAANLYCWMSYTIYDHVIDGEPALEYLPLANEAMRLSLELYRSLCPKSHSVFSTIRTTFTDMDLANAWEMKYCRLTREGKSLIVTSLPTYYDYTILAKRSFGHVLGPLILAARAHISVSELSHIHNGLGHYLIARQLNDDMHDWQDDMRSGHCSPVVTHLLQELHASGSHPVEGLVGEARNVFWTSSMAYFNNVIRHHVTQAIHHLHQCQSLETEGELFNLIDRLKDSAEAAPLEHIRHQKFLATFKEEL